MVCEEPAFLNQPLPPHPLEMIEPETPDQEQQPPEVIKPENMPVNQAALRLDAPSVTPSITHNELTYNDFTGKDLGDKPKPNDSMME